MGFFKKIACHIIGWKYDLLQRCGEKSHRMLRKYVSALVILLIIWFTIGFVFSQRYLGIMSIGGKICTGLVFALIVLSIERIIILNSGGTKIYLIRTVLAIIMSLLGAFIFDQMIFRNDLEKAIKKAEKERIISERDTLIKEVSSQIAELSALNDSLNMEIEKKPTITMISKTTVMQKVKDPETGEIVERPRVIITTNQTPSPLIDQVNENLERIKLYDEQIRKYQNDKAQVDSIVEQNFEANKIGFLEEMEASIQVIGQSWITIVFYFALMAFMLLLEVMTLSIRWGDSGCEYDSIVEHQYKAQKLKLENAFKRLVEESHQNTLDTEALSEQLD